MLKGKRNRQARGRQVPRRTERMSESLLRQTEVRLNKKKRCNKKRRFKTEELAQVHCEKLNGRVVFEVIPLKPYFCIRHNSWHIGHDFYEYRARRNELVHRFPVKIEDRSKNDEQTII